MGKINLLEKDIYELIAAGEVIERPASVVKELVENSIDAKAKSIFVDIKDGGKSLIRVIDDGIGMDCDDCKLAFLRHATSKVSTKMDLNSIETLGFRGEALASICAVSKVEVLTKRQEDELGVRYFIEAGEEKSIESVSCSNGAMFSINQLFYNVPARLKFLKKDSTEASAIQDILEKLAISNYNVAFRFKKNGKKVFQTSGDGSLDDVVYNIFGRDLYKSLLHVKYDDGNIRIDGFISDPRYCRSNRNIQYSFINGRYVKSKTCVCGVEEAFKGFAMIGKHPAFVLFLDMPSEKIDINVHPAKVEVRFSDEAEVLRAIYSAVRASINENNKLPEAKIPDLKRNYFAADNTNEQQMEISTNNVVKNKTDVYEPNVAVDNFFTSVKSYSTDCDEDFSKYKFLSNANIFKSSEIKLKDGKHFENINDSLSYDNNKAIKEEKIKLNNEDNNINKNFEKLNYDESAKAIVSSEKQDYLRIVGEIFKTYILVEVGNNFVVIDKHAAHERILYEKIKKNADRLERQILLLPKKIVLDSNEDYELILDNSEIFIQFGFGVEDFGGRSILIREIPMILDDKNFVEVFEEIVLNLKTKINDFTPATLDNLYHTMACRAAVKANDDNNIEELKALVDQVYFDENIRTCPHGRPVVLTFSKERFDREFGRIQR